VSAQPIAQRRGFLAALMAQVSSYVLEPLAEEQVDATEPAELVPHPVIAVVPAAPRSGATTVARLLAAELAFRCEGAAVVAGPGGWGRRAAPASRAAARVATALGSLPGAVRATGRLCLVGGLEAPRVVAAARYLAPVVLDQPADGTGLAAAREADRCVIVASAAQEPALADAVAVVLGGQPVKVVTRAGDAEAWEGRAEVVVPDARIAVRAALTGTRPLGALGAAISELADAVGVKVR